MIDDLIEHIVTWVEVELLRTFPISPQHKAISTLFVYATRREQDGDPRLLTAFLRVAKDFPQSSNWIRYPFGAAVSELLGKESSNLQKRAAVLAAPLMPQSWKFIEDKGEFINAWLSAVHRVKEMGGVTEGAIRMSFDMVWDNEWRPHMTPEVWALLKRGHRTWTLYWKGHPFVVEGAGVIPAVRSLGDVEILTSFLILTWSGLDVVPDELTDQMCAALREEYGIGGDAYREELLQCLDCALEHLNQMQGGLTPVGQFWYPDSDLARSDPGSFILDRRLAAYERLRKELLDVEGATAVARISRWSRTSCFRLYRLRLYRPPRRPWSTLYVCPAIAVAVVTCLQPTQLCGRCPSSFCPWATPNVYHSICLSSRIRRIILAGDDSSTLVSYPLLCFCSSLFLFGPHVSEPFVSSPAGILWALAVPVLPSFSLSVSRSAKPVLCMVYGTQ